MFMLFNIQDKVIITFWEQNSIEIKKGNVQVRWLEHVAPFSTKRYDLPNYYIWRNTKENSDTNIFLKIGDHEKCNKVIKMKIELNKGEI